MKPTKYQKEIIDFLGPEYQMSDVTGTYSLYRKLNDCYDIEILGTHGRNIPFTVIVCDISSGSPKPPVAEAHHDITTLRHLERVLDEVCWKYAHPKPDAE